MIDWSSLSSAFSSNISERVAAFLPSLAVAVAIALIGWLLARIAGAVARRIAGGAMGRLSERSRFAEALATGKLSARIPHILRAAVFWLVFVLFLGAAVEQLHIPALSNLLNELAGYWPRLIAGLFVFIIGLILGNALESWVSASLAAGGVTRAEALGKAARIAVVFIALVMAADQVGIESTFLIVAAGILLAVGALGIALAFASGSQSAVGNLVASHYVSQQLEAGNVAKIDGFEGVIRRVTPTSVVLEHEGREVHIPAKRFLDSVTIIEEAPEA